jgi:hypothetical protein
MTQYDIDPLWDYVEVDPKVVRVDLLLEKAQVRCPQCCNWHWYSDLVKKPAAFSSSVGWRRTYHCPSCRAQVGSDDTVDFETLIIETLESGIEQDWVRLSTLRVGGAS